jgi:hypothetical protein
VSKLALDPVNHPTATADPTTPTIRAGDSYFNTSDNSFRVYNGSAWIALTSSSTVTSIDAGAADSIAPYAGGRASQTATQTVNGGSA